jgi:hypothetical protein
MMDEEAEPGIGDNDGATPADIAEAAAEIIELRSARGSASAILAGAYVRWEKKGVDRDALKYAIDLKTEGALAAKIQRKRTRYAIAIGAIHIADDAWTMAAKQGEMDELVARGDVADRVRYNLARQQGQSAGRRNTPITSNPYRSQPGSPEYIGFLDGHDEGLSQLAKINPDAVKREHAPEDRERDEADLEEAAE